MRGVELKYVLIQRTTPHPRPLHPQEVRRWVPRCCAATLPQSRLREKGVNSSTEKELEEDSIQLAIRCPVWNKAPTLVNEWSMLEIANRQS